VKEKKLPDGYWKYSTMALEMMVIIGVGIALGHWADKQFHIQPYGKAAGALLFVIISIYRVVKDFSK
jgi:F0F1-type ATP synthase assembly protein I